jgi:hypothetical protein
MRVYHFLSAANALSNLIFRRLRISRYADLNDPFELLAFNVGDPGIRNAMALYRDEFNKKFGLLCFCRTIDSPLLWSHYADKHRGICLAFDVHEEYALPIQYSKDRIVVEFEGNDRSKGRISERSVNALLATKYEQWRYEEEVRMQVRLESEEAGSFFAPFADGLVLREVILGVACELPLHPLYEMLDKCYGKDVELFKVAQAYKWFAMVKQKVELKE